MAIDPTGAINGAAGAVLGLALERHNDRRQVKQQKKLTDVQVNANKQMTDYNTAANYKSQLDMWKATNYGAQMDEIKKAGLNPALLYGMSGGGGTTVGSGAIAGNVSGGQAAGNSGETGMGIMNQMNLAMQQAQIDNLKANTNKTNAEAGNVGAIGENIMADTQTKLQSIKDSQVKNDYTNSLQKGQELENELTGKTNYVKVRLLEQSLEQGEELLKSMAVNAEIAQETKVDLIATAQATRIEAFARAALIKANTAQTNASIDKMAADIAQGWKKLAIDQMNYEINKQEAGYKGAQIEINKQLADFETGFGTQGGAILKTVLDNIPMGKTIGKVVNWIKGSKQKIGFNTKK
jgi:hypothetical protein